MFRNLWNNLVLLFCGYNSTKFIFKTVAAVKKFFFSNIQVTDSDYKVRIIIYKRIIAYHKYVESLPFYKENSFVNGIRLLNGFCDCIYQMRIYNDVFLYDDLKDLPELMLYKPKETYYDGPYWFTIDDTQGITKRKEIAMKALKHLEP